VPTTDDVTREAGAEGRESRVEVSVSSPVVDSFRVQQVAGMFDLKLDGQVGETFSAELPAADDDWRLGVIVGPSGSGKTTIAKKAYGRRLAERFRWPKDKAVIDGFADSLSVKEVVRTLNAVGFSSPPSWLKPYHVLSGGERFRADLARALLSPDKLVAVDEFTSVVDRTVGKIGSAAVSKAIRKRRLDKKLVAVTCHYDVIDWLEPDWVLDMASCQLARGCLWRRPKIDLEIAPVHRSAWVLFRRHHYLNHDLLVGAKCFAAFWHDEPVGFSAWLHAMSKKRRQGDMREHRTVILPDYQGVGIGNRLSEFCASIWAGLGGRASSTTSHPSMIRYRSTSPNWHRHRLGRTSPVGHTGRFALSSKTGKYEGNSCGRVTGGFQYVGPPMDRELAERFVAATPAVFAKRASVERIEALVRRWPGVTVGCLTRLTGMSTTGVRHNLDELVEAGDVTTAGRGGGGGKQKAYYPAE